MHEIAFADSVIQTPVKVLGLTLKGYSIGHELLLAKQRNPLVILNGQQFSVFTPESQVRAIQNAILVCYRSWNENKRPEKWLKLWQWRIRRMDHGKAIEDFLNYRHAGSSFPRGPSKDVVTILNDMEGKSNDGGGRFLGSPFLCRLYNFICKMPESEIRIHGETAFDFPMGLGAFLYMAHLEQEGSAQVENEKEAEMRKEIEGHLEAIPLERRIV